MTNLVVGETGAQLLLVQELTFNQPSRPKGLKMVSEPKFCTEYENSFLSAGLGALRHQRGLITLPLAKAP